MKASRLSLVVAALLITTHRLPAPIVEEQKPTPAPSQSETPKRKHSTRSTSSSEQQSSKQTESKPKATPMPAPAKKFAGKWSGIMPEVPWGDVQTELIVDPSETQIEWQEKGVHKGTAKAQLNGNTLSARIPIGFTTAVWYITPNADGTMANIRMTAFANDDHAVFRRTSK